MVVATELLAERIRYRNLERIRRAASGSASRKTSITPPSAASLLPLETAEMIIADISYNMDMDSLRGCSLTCYSWYISAIPHLYRTLGIKLDFRTRKPQLRSPKYRSKHGSLPLATKFHIASYRPHRTDKFPPKILSCGTICKFPAFTNVQELWSGCLDIPKRTSRLQRYSRHFFPTVRCLASKDHRHIYTSLGYFSTGMTLNSSSPRPPSPTTSQWMSPPSCRTLPRYYEGGWQ